MNLERIDIRIDLTESFDGKISRRLTAKARYVHDDWNFIAVLPLELKDAELVRYSLNLIQTALCMAIEDRLIVIARNA